ncbi:MAG: hypothetical protein GBAus27B_000068 [Mycoplasmataceae bacterium]|nr:MAG: hypothetical protein GBAus27B_000068 [Mycoplasmataceae bacterium]
MTEEERKNWEEQLNQDWGANDEEPDSNEQDKIIAQIILLLGQAETALQNKDYSQLKELIIQIKELTSQVKDGLKMDSLQERIARLEQALVVQENVSEPNNYWPAIIGLLIIILLFFFYLIIKWVIADVKRQIR